MSTQMTDARNRKIVEQDMSGADTFTTRFTYDTGGNLIRKNNRGQTLTWDMIETKTARNRKTVEQDMSGTDTFTTRFTYDTTGNLIAVWGEQ